MWRSIFLDSWYLLSSRRRILILLIHLTFSGIRWVLSYDILFLIPSLAILSWILCIIIPTRKPASQSHQDKSSYSNIT
uniref:Uncharacterized protein n=1 Tax=Piliocolobus tephrosceles TaxID=591936 RepID=A0A8C9IVV6_9PRIM